MDMPSQSLKLFCALSDDISVFGFPEGDPN